ncbi:Phosphate-specific transport system accessory protein PhoU [subsurface metagenome]
MTTNKDMAIQKIIQEFEKLSNLILEQLDILNEVFKSYNAGIPDKIIQKLDENEKKIDNYEVKLDDRIIKTIVLYKPVASDLRQLFAVYRMVINLERIGDLVIKITNLIIEIKGSDLLKKSSSMLHQMLKFTLKMVSKALLSFFNSNKESALWTIKKDVVIDELNQKYFRKTIKRSKQPKELQELLISVVDIRSIISSIERIGDHARNIAEASIYALLGTNVRHQTFKSKEI